MHLEKATATHSSTLAWKIPWLEEPAGLQFMGSLQVGHDWASWLALSCIGERNGNPLQCSCLENPRDGGTWWAAVYGVAHDWSNLAAAAAHASVQFSRSVLSDSLRPHELQFTRPPCLSPTPRVYPNSCPSSQWCHPTISPSVIPFSSCPQSFPTSGSFQMSQLFTSGGQSIGVSASTLVLPMNMHSCYQDWNFFF